MSASPAKIEPGDYEQHADWLRSLARSLVRDPSAADDIVQETWLSALRHGPSRDESLRPWLTRVAQNAARKLYRSEGRRRDRERLAAPAEVPLMSAAELSESADLIHTLMGEVRELAEPYRSTVLQSYLQGMTSQEIAERTETAEGTVRWRLSVARDELRERMDRKVGSREGWALLAAPMGVHAQLGAAKSVAGAAGRSKAWFSFSGLLPAALVISVLGVVAIAIRTSSADGVFEAPIANDGALEAPLEVGAAAVSDGQRARTALATPARPAAPAAAAATAPRWKLDSGQASLRVRALDDLGDPIKGASLMWNGHPDVRISTDAKGLAQLVFRPPVSGGEMEFLLHADGYVAQRLEVPISAGDARDLGSARLGKSLRRRGQVLFADGSPASGVSVFAAPDKGAGRSGSSALRARTAPDPWPSVLLESALTGRDGKFQLEGLPRERMRLWAECEGMWLAASEPLEPDADEPSADEPVRIVLEPLPDHEAIEGTALGLDGQPAADVLVRLRARGTPGAAAELTTDKEGRFRFQPRRLVSYEVLGEDLLDRWKNTDWKPVDPGEAGVFLRFTEELR